MNKEDVNKCLEEIQKLKKSYEDICKVEILIYNDLTVIDQHIVKGDADIKELERAKTSLNNVLADSDTAKNKIIEQINELSNQINRINMN